jgi:hypothetical protein
MTDFDIDIDAGTRAAFAGIIGKRCCRQRAGEYKSLSLGFGEKVPHLRKKSVDSFKGEWEIGTYSSAWRIVKSGAILCGSMNPVDSNEELEQQVEALQLGAVMSIEMLSKFDIRITLDDGTFIEFMEHGGHPLAPSSQEVEQNTRTNDCDKVFYLPSPQACFKMLSCLLPRRVVA